MGQSSRAVKGRGRVSGLSRPLDADWPPRLSIIAEVAPRYPGRLWSSSAQHHLWQTHLDGYMASPWRPVSLAVFSFVFLQTSSSYEQLSAFVEGRWVHYSEISERRGLLVVPFIQMWNKDCIYWLCICAFMKRWWTGVAETN